MSSDKQAIRWENCIFCKRLDCDHLTPLVMHYGKKAFWWVFFAFWALVLLGVLYAGFPGQA